MLDLTSLSYVTLERFCEGLPPLVVVTLYDLVAQGCLKSVGGTVGGGVPLYSVAELTILGAVCVDVVKARETRKVHGAHRAMRHYSRPDISRALSDATAALVELKDMEPMLCSVRQRLREQWQERTQRLFVAD